MSDEEVGRLVAKIVVDDKDGDQALNRFEQKFRGLDQRISSGGGLKLGAAIGGGLALAGMAIEATLRAADEIGPRAAMSWEKGMGGAIKTLNIDKYDPGTGKLSAAYQSLNSDLLDLRANMRGVGQEDIYGTAQALGSLGIAQDQIKSTTQTVLQDAAAFGMTTDETATKLATINQLWDEQSQKLGGAEQVFKRVGSAVNELGNNYSATESNVLSFLESAGGTLTTYDVGMEQGAAMGAFLQTLGISGPEGATAIRSALSEGLFSTAVETSKDPRGYKLAADLLGISGSDFKDRISKDLMGTLVDVATAVDRMPINAAEKDILYSKLFGAYGKQLGSKIAGRGDLYEEMLGVSQEGFEDGTSAEKEYERQTDNLSGALDELYGALDVARIEAWTSALEPAKGIVEGLAQGVRDATPLIKELFDALWTGDTSFFADKLTQAVAELQNTDFSSLGRTFAERVKEALWSGDWSLAGIIIKQLSQMDPTELGYHLLNALQAAWDFAMGALSIGEGADPVQIFWGFIDGFRRVVDWIAKLLTPLATYVSIELDQMTVNALSGMSGFVAAFANGFITIYNTAVVVFSALVSYISGVVGEIKASASDIWNSITGQGGETGPFDPNREYYSGSDLYTGRELNQSGADSSDYKEYVEGTVSLGSGRRPGGKQGSAISLKEGSGTSPAAGKTPTEFQTTKEEKLAPQVASATLTGSRGQGSTTMGTGTTALDYHMEPILRTMAADVSSVFSDYFAGNTGSLVQKYLGLNEADMGGLSDKLLKLWDADEIRQNWGLEGLQSDIDARRAALQTERDAFAQELQLESAGFGKIAGMATSEALKDVFAGLNNVTQAANSTAVATDSLAGSVAATGADLERGQSLLDKTAESLDNWCEAASDFALAQEQMSDVLFNQSYIGASGEQYLAFLESEASRGAYHPAPIQLGEDYKSESLAYIEQLKAEVANPQTMPVEANTDSATSSVRELSTLAQKEQQMPVQLSGIDAAMSQASALHAALSQTAYKTVVVTEVGGAGGSYGDVGYGDTWNYADTWTFPHFAGGGYVSEPTLAIIGDAPGGEYVLNQDQMSSLRRSGNAPVVQVNVTVNGDVTGEELVEFIKSETVKEVGYLLNRGGSA